MRFAERLGSELAYLSGALRILRRVTPLMKARERTISDSLAEWGRRWGNRPALISPRETFTYADLDGRANRYARWAREQGVGKGDAVALLMPNRPEYMAAWLGIGRAGGVTALLNTNLSGTALAHCITIARPKAMIVAAELLPVFESAVGGIAPGLRVFVHGPSPMAYPRVDEMVDAQLAAELSPTERVPLTIEDTCLYIYTSGTTGLPKAANINHYRVQAAMHAFSALTQATADDRTYITLPMYHTTGGVLAPGITLTVGGSAVLKEKFSASQFWDDIVQHRCTMFQYIGELCRYLLNSPVSPNETRHEIRVCNGNGLRPDIWMDFKTRFRIPKIMEWYAATEGNVQLFNMDGRPGSVGRIPKWLERKFLTKIVRFDVAAERPVRGPDGFCIECAPGEIGEAIGKIVVDPAKPGQRFDGYADPAESARKIMRDVFEKGDAWFRTGDLMKKDELGYFYFMDRIGDTFRWKGENVSTSQVAETLTAFPGVREANVYGVVVPGGDGRAGMAAIVADDDLDIAGLSRHIARELPDFARPIFLRVRQELDHTSTFKLRKVELVAEGFDPNRITDPLFVWPAGGDGFVRLDPPLHARLARGEIRI